MGIFSNHKKCPRFYFQVLKTRIVPSHKYLSSNCSFSKLMVSPHFSLSLSLAFFVLHTFLLRLHFFLPFWLNGFLCFYFSLLTCTRSRLLRNLQNPVFFFLFFSSLKFHQKNKKKNKPNNNQPRNLTWNDTSLEIRNTMKGRLHVFGRHCRKGFKRISN